jgi:hypothetical protein
LFVISAPVTASLLLLSYVTIYELRPKIQWPTLRNLLLISWSRKSAIFMEPQASLLCWQQPATGPHPQPFESSLCPHILHK